MAKIGTAHVEVKPVLNDEALKHLGERIQATVAAAVARGIEEGSRTTSARSSRRPAPRPMPGIREDGRRVE